MYNRVYNMQMREKVFLLSRTFHFGDNSHKKKKIKKKHWYERCFYQTERSVFIYIGISNKLFFVTVSFSISEKQSININIFFLYTAFLGIILFSPKKFRAPRCTEILAKLLLFLHIFFKYSYFFLSFQSRPRCLQPMQTVVEHFSQDAGGIGPSCYRSRVISS